MAISEGPTPPFAVRIEDIPYESDEKVQRNVEALLLSIETGLRSDLGIGKLHAFSKSVLLCLRRYLQRFRRNLDEEADFLAWIARCVYELRLLTNYALDGPDQLEEIFLQVAKDYKDLNRAWFEGSDSEQHGDDAIAFQRQLDALLGAIDADGLDVPDKYLRYKKLAEEAGELREYFLVFKTCSKYAHPTPILLLGSSDFVFGDNTRFNMIVLIQLFAAKLLGEMPKLISNMMGGQ